MLGYIVIPGAVRILSFISEDKTAAPVHDSVSIATGLTTCLGVYVSISSHVSPPVDSYWTVSMLLWLPSSLGNALERALVIWCSVALTVSTLPSSPHSWFINAFEVPCHPPYMARHHGPSFPPTHTCLMCSRHPFHLSVSTASAHLVWTWSGLGPHIGLSHLFILPTCYVSCVHMFLLTSLGTGRVSPVHTHLVSLHVRLSPGVLPTSQCLLHTCPAHLVTVPVDLSPCVCLLTCCILPTSLCLLPHMSCPPH